MGNSTYCVYGGPVLGGGMAFSSVGEWGTPTPYYRGSSMYGGDIATNTRLWRLRGYWNVVMIAEGILIATNSFDGYLYAIGKGSSKTEVSVMSSNVAKGDTVWITGNVLDQSPALMGKPCLSVTEGGDTTQKEGKQNGGSLSAYQENLFMQQPASMNLIGVPVSMFAINSTGYVFDLGKTTSNGNGDFVLKWTPPSEDYYLITASFTGDQSYYSSYDVTSVAVGAAPKEIVFPDPTPATEIPAYQTIDLAIIAAVAVAIIIGVVNLLALRKRK
jgi:hypothetical protein